MKKKKESSSSFAIVISRASSEDAQPFEVVEKGWQIVFCSWVLGVSGMQRSCSVLIARVCTCFCDVWRRRSASIQLIPLYPANLYGGKEVESTKMARSNQQIGSALCAKISALSQHYQRQSVLLFTIRGKKWYRIIKVIHSFTFNFCVMALVSKSYKFCL